MFKVFYAAKTFCPNNVKYFRLGNYSNASEDVKRSWIIFVGKIMPYINKKWNDEELKTKSLMSIHTTPSDEALAITAIGNKYLYWCQSTNELINCEESNLSTAVKKKRIRDKWKDEDIVSFYEKQVETSRLRKDSDTGKSWDEGYRDYLSSLLSPAIQATKRNIQILRQAFFDDIDSSTLNSTNNSNKTFMECSEHNPKRKKSQGHSNIPLDLYNADDNDTSVPT